MNNRPHLPRLRPVLLGVAALVLTGCTTFSRDGGLDAVGAMTAERTGQMVQFSKPGAEQASVADTVNQLLAKPLTADSAVQVALLNNKELQSAFARLGIAEADLVQAGWMSNPSFSFGRSSGPHSVEIERAIMFDIVGLLTLPVRSKIEAGRFESAKLQAAAEAVRIAADTRKAYFNAVAARQTADYTEQVRTAAEASAELARRMAKVGNLSKLDQAREQAFYSDATAQLARSAHNATSAREQLARLMGLWGRQAAAFQLPDRLPDLPNAPAPGDRLEARAMQQRLDVQIAKRETAMTASALGLSKATRFVNVLHGGYVNRSVSGEERENGYEIELALPLFDWGGSRVAKAEAIYMQSVSKTAETAVRARSQVREAYSAYRTTYDVAKHYRDEVIPLRKQISDEMLLRYNGMLISTFDLLADARAQITAVNASIDALRDYWIAETELQAAVNGSGASPMQMNTQVAGDAPQGH